MKISVRQFVYVVAQQPEFYVRGKRRSTYNLMSDDRPLTERCSDFNRRPSSGRDLAEQNRNAANLRNLQIACG